MRGAFRKVGDAMLTPPIRGVMYLLPFWTLQTLALYFAKPYLSGSQFWTMRACQLFGCPIVCAGAVFILHRATSPREEKLSLLLTTLCAGTSSWCLLTDLFPSLKGFLSAILVFHVFLACVVTAVVSVLTTPRVMVPILIGAPPLPVQPPVPSVITLPWWDTRPPARCTLRPRHIRVAHSNS
jgi:hypothetical protein